MEQPQTPGVTVGARDEALLQHASVEKRRRQPRNSACQACASLKMKCVPSQDLAGKCERCARMNRDCAASVPKSRKRQSLGDEQELQQPRATATTPRASAPDAGRPPSTSQGQVPGSRQPMLAQPDLTHTGSQSFIRVLAQGLRLEASDETLLRGLDYNYVQSSFTVYRQLAVHFPFFALRPDASAVSMSAERPMTMLAICVVTSSSHADLHARLVRAFRRCLSAKVIERGERGIDVLNGLMVFLAWHHNYMVNQQINQLVFLLAGMASDLGMYRQPYRNDALSLAAVLEQDRTFLGCYYLCCGLSVMGFDKPCPLRWTDNLRRCAENVAMSGNQPQDGSLVGVIELVRTIYDLHDVLRAGGEAKRPSYPAYAEMHTKATSYRLKALKREHPQLAGTLGYAAANIHFHHRLLRANDAPDTATLIQCACAIKEYLDDLLGRPPATLHHMAIVDWTNLLEILILTARVSKPLPNAGGWEAGALSSMLQPDAVLDAICAHMAAAPSGDPLAPRNEAQLRWFRGVCDNIKRRITHDRTGYVGGLRDEESQYDAVHSLGQNGQSAQGRFRPVNEPYGSELPMPVQSPQQASGMLDAFNMFDGGLLDDVFWNNFLAG